MSLMTVMRARLRLGAAPGRRPGPARSLRSIIAGATLASYSGLGLLIGLAILDVAWASPGARPSVVVLSILALLAYGTGSSRQDVRPVLGSVLSIAVASCVADLPVHRVDWIVFAAVAGSLVLILVELGTVAVEPTAPAKHIRHPNLVRVLWVACTAGGGGVLGWLLVSLRSGLAGLGLFALGVGVAAAICVVVLAGALLHTLLDESEGGDTG